MSKVLDFIIKDSPQPDKVILEIFDVNNNGYVEKQITFDDADSAQATATGHAYKSLNGKSTAELTLLQDVINVHL